MNPNLPAAIELDMKNIQGKGKGGESVSAEVTAAISFLSKFNISEPVIFDVGANVGLYSQAILNQIPNSKVFAFEPSQTSRKILENRFLNDSRVTVIPFALGSEVASRTLWSDQAGSGLASLTKRRLEHFNIDFNYAEEVQVTTLDTWAKSQKEKPDFIKMDVEGHELDVLDGGRDVLSSVRVIQFEFGGCNIDTRTYFQDFWYFFQAHGFSLYRITPKGPIQIVKYSEEDECFNTTNYLAVRN
jgi:FkbM family methyltransferase